MKLDQLPSLLTNETAPDCEIYNQFLHAINLAARTSGITRHGIANRMNQALKVESIIVTESSLNKYLAPSTEKYLPAHMIPALLWAVKSIEPINVLLQPLMFKAVDQRAQMLQQHAELEMEIEKHKELQQEIKNTLLTNPSD
ncbi:hypothetical protein [Pseudoalteromonas denitrificans]|jgi:hypothetical protein|uniref:Uncharacterized protein n=1 Tax=Pseudoalteromonas denitrificans DSM 6059 TaxID=1123010 RepID=A0A1I1TGE9_9GAMM|nr:hypothetical protein [Pseudoalteromonas denitrificans]SFD54630.1 hypothetical protein SAMN02745724_04808 [Pseudoalteromonas denitrificans DSM 6059]